MTLHQISTLEDLTVFQALFFRERSRIGEIKPEGCHPDEVLPLSLLRNLQVYFIRQKNLIVGGFCLQSGEQFYSLEVIQSVCRRTYLKRRLESLSNLVEVLYFWTIKSMNQHRGKYRRFLVLFAETIAKCGYRYVLCRTTNRQLVKSLSRLRLVMKLSTEEIGGEIHYVMMCRVSDLGNILSRLIAKKVIGRLRSVLMRISGCKNQKDEEEREIQFHPDGQLLMWEVLSVADRNSKKICNRSN